ncbi:unnamed protein product [Orchesella dallaii]|uniref:Protein kinase domain-containing protein n=1 Tax=Orchesella dallaii TaxID=48710 RepID=A0ABP1QIP0_9HEXA
MDFKKLFNKFRSRNISHKNVDQDQVKGKPEDIEEKDCSINSDKESPSSEPESEGKLDIDIDWQQIIGFGNFSVVYVGFLKGVSEPVAVKIPRAWDDSEGHSHKNVLKEVSIMETIGKHENVLEILGFRNISDSFISLQSTVGIITPLCVNGSLQKYLRSKPVDTTVIGDDHSEKNCIQEVVSQAESLSVMNFYELLKFSYEIAQGMNYLSSKNVVHGDVAARNVLLDSNKTCKISDFGLSKLIEKEDPSDSCSNAEKATKTERRTLAWRWMAVECLEGNDVSIQSDVWAYGVTLWEIFTIGDAPFPRHSCNSEFLQNLKSGLPQLQKPKYASIQVYNTMLNCWNPNPDSRPTFPALATLFHKLLEKIQSLKIQQMNTEHQQPLLKIREKRPFPREELESGSQPQQLNQKLSVRHGANRNKDSNALFLKYELKNVKFANKHKSNMFFEKLDGTTVCVRRCIESSKRGQRVLESMAIVGDHPHVSKFFGIFYDNDLLTGEKYLNIVSEFFHKRSIREYFHSKPQEDYNDISAYNSNSTFRLVCKFAAEIGRGMEFISSKQILQGDLSSRLVFVDGNLTCKILLSHMARTVEDNEIYIKTTPDHVSWRILAVETLKRLEFSMKTDVWAFGITVWEIFSLGKDIFL